MGGTGINSLVVKFICSVVMEMNTTLTELDLSCNNIGVDGVSAISRLISTNSALKKLNLSSCGLDDRGAFILSEGIPLNDTLTSLCLNNNFDVRVDGSLRLLAAVSMNVMLVDCAETMGEFNFGEMEDELGINRSRGVEWMDKLQKVSDHKIQKAFSGQFYRFV